MRTRPRCVAVIVALTLQSLAVVHAVPPGWAQADQPANELKRPAYQLRRFDEDWSVLKGVDLKSAPAGPRGGRADVRRR
jgi:hypothetical protein